MGWQTRLKKQLKEERLNVRWLLMGASVFFIGMGLIYYSEHFLSSSLQQEMVALGGLLLLGCGALVAAVGYSLVLLNRLGIFNDDD